MKNILILVLYFFFDISLGIAQKEIKIPAISGDYVNIYNPKGDIYKGPNTIELRNGKFYKNWIPNDHCFIKDDRDIWHLFGITHPKTSINAIHEGEVMSFHAVSPQGTFKELLKKKSWKDMPKVLTPDKRPNDLPDFYAPICLRKSGMYYLIWGPTAPLRYATSNDLYNWNYKGILINTPDDRDPDVLFFDGEYYLITCGKYCINIATSFDLINWTPHDPIIARSDSVDFESPKLIRYNGTFYLFACAWDKSKWDGKSISGAYQHITYVFQSDSIFKFNQPPITQINAHAPEILQDESGDWYISSAEYPKRGVSIAKLIWK